MADTPTGAPMPATGDRSKNQWDSYRAVEFDVHQVLTDAARSPDIGNPNPEMIQLAKDVLAQDPRNRLIVACGGFKQYGQQYMDQVRRWLAKQGIDVRRVDLQTKPRTLAVIDDHAIQYIKGAEKDILEEVMDRFNRLDQEGPDVLMPSAGPINHQRALMKKEFADSERTCEHCGGTGKVSTSSSPPKSYQVVQPLGSR